MRWRGVLHVLLLQPSFATTVRILENHKRPRRRPQVLPAIVATHCCRLLANVTRRFNQATDPFRQDANTDLLWPYQATRRQNPCGKKSNSKKRRPSQPAVVRIWPEGSAILLSRLSDCDTCIQPQHNAVFRDRLQPSQSPCRLSTTDPESPQKTAASRKNEVVSDIDVRY